MSATGPRTMASDARRLRALEDENGKLEKLLAEAMLDTAILKDVAPKKFARGVKREAVAHVVEIHGVSRRRACQARAVDRSSVRYRSVRLPCCARFSSRPIFGFR